MLTEEKVNAIRFVRSPVWKLSTDYIHILFLCQMHRLIIGKRRSTSRSECVVPPLHLLSIYAKFRNRGSTPNARLQGARELLF